MQNPTHDFVLAFWHIAQKEFLSNILSLRFFVAFLLAFILMVISAYVLTSDYGHQVEDLVSLADPTLLNPLLFPPFYYRHF